MRLRKLYFGYLRHVVPWFGQLSCGDRSAYAYLLESLEQYPAQRGVDEMMKEAGFVETRIEPLLGGIMSINFGVTRRAT